MAAETGAGDALDDLNRAAIRLADLWHPHIHKEERFYDVDRMAALTDVEEHARLRGALGQFTQEHMQSPFLGIPFVLYNLPAGERAILAQMMPPAMIQQLVPVDWMERWAPMQPFLLD